MTSLNCCSQVSDNPKPSSSGLFHFLLVSPNNPPPRRHARTLTSPPTQAFQTGDMSSLRDILETSSSPSPSGVNYRRRLGDATTALMAAAFHGDLDTVRLLLSLGAETSLVDAAGKTAAVFAGMRGHRECFAELQRAADEEEEEQRARSGKGRRSAGDGGGGGGEGAGGDGHDFVYDLYYFEPSASMSPAGEASAAGGGGGAAGVPAAISKVGDKVGLLSVLAAC